MVLHPADKTVQIIEAPVCNVGGNNRRLCPCRKWKAALKPTGQKQSIDGVCCDEYRVDDDALDGRDGRGRTDAPEAADMLKDMRVLMNGSVWMAKSAAGAAEFAAVTKAMMDAQLAGLVNGRRQRPVVERHGQGDARAAGRRRHAVPHRVPMTSRGAGRPPTC